MLSKMFLQTQAKIHLASLSKIALLNAHNLFCLFEQGITFGEFLQQWGDNTMVDCLLACPSVRLCSSLKCFSISLLWKL